MTEAYADRFADPGAITGYHAHIYYDPAATRTAAARLREGMGAAFPAATLGGWHDEAVGPHTVAMYQVAFAVEDFARLVPWLMLNRGGLDVLVHPLAGNAYDDHTVYAMWLGDKLPLKLDVLKRVKC
ncbi:MAG TPA: DOPA 4,5-dioxygenase family protein [Stellaceae bacterium]|nr:DOPA 4,5-dioxygenase family protein [Stellaceae bacterium]